jgi:hypothetical protein
MTLRKRLATPAPQVLEQAVYFVQAVTTQSTGQAWALHSFLWIMEPQALPLYKGLVEMMRTRDWTPEPQVLVQAEYLPQGVRTQSIGQAILAHATVWERAAQALPLFLAATVTRRVRVFVPPAQDLVQAEYLPQAETWQSTGQPTSSHWTVCLRAGQRPSLLFMMIERVRLLLPTPQVVEQVE